MNIVWTGNYKLKTHNGIEVPVEILEMWENVTLSKERPSVMKAAMVRDIMYNSWEFKNIPTTMYMLEN